jgi:transcriptional regulator with XRE-family HTH domain
VADSAGLDRTYVSGIERGVRNPSLKNIGRLAEVLKVSLKELFSF